MSDKHMCDYSTRRLEKSADDLDTAQINYNAGKYNASANRAYYSVYHAIRAVLALDNIERKKHSGNISYFRENYIATDIFDRIYSETIKNTEVLRNEADYDDMKIVNAEDAQEVIEKARNFYNEVKKYVEYRIKKILITVNVK
ncbi:MAG: HEPN domain-containing protein [Oscillospiraceae bacterium]|nr:HEPN domain-containing protein [Oscillospiraceae bacterium]